MLCCDGLFRFSHCLYNVSTDNHKIVSIGKGNDMQTIFIKSFNPVLPTATWLPTKMTIQLTCNDDTFIGKYATDLSSEDMLVSVHFGI